MVKKITAALFFVLAGTSALAAQTDNSMPMVSGVVLIAPHQEGSWSFGLQANYLEPDTDYKYFHTALDTPNFFPLDGEDSNRIYTVGSDYDWGWGADISYHFPGNGRDVNLAFTQLNTSHSDSEEDPNQSFTLGGGAIDIQQSGDHSAKVETNYNSADLTFGQLIAVGQRLSLHPFAGLRYASIDYKAKARGDDAYNASNPFSATEFAFDVTNESTWKSDFQGLGPRFGSDAGVNLGRGFSLQSTLGLSLLVGNIDVREKISSHEVLTLYSPFIPDQVIIDETTNTNNKIDTNTRVVPEADAKLSLMYKVDVNNGYSLGFEGGYQVTNYFDAIQNSVISTQDTSTQYTSYFIQGPYARVELDVA
jgi:hypothetical protein